MGHYLLPGTGPLPVIYRSFDTLDDLVLMKGNNVENFNALVAGQVREKIALENNYKRRI